MLTYQAPQTTGINESGVQFSTGISDELRIALDTAGVNLDAVRAQPDGTVYIDLPEAEGGRIAIGEEDGWITAACYTDGEDGTPLFEGTELTELASTVAQRIS